jgi:DNA-binding XRE family transcriptional regulator
MSMLFLFSSKGVENFPISCYDHQCIGIPNLRPEKDKKKRDKVNKFADWMKSNDKKQRGVAEKLHISTSTLHDILRKGQLPSLKLAYEIEKYTKGAVTVYDWIDQEQEVQYTVKNTKPKTIKNKIDK